MKDAQALNGGIPVNPLTCHVRRARYALLVVVLLLGLVPFAATALGGPPADRDWSGEPTVQPGHRTIANLPTGTEAGAVGRDLAGDHPLGATAFCIAPNGDFLIADNANLRITTIASTGQYLGHVDLPDSIPCVADIAVTDAALYLLDVTSQPAKVHVVDTAGMPIEAIEIPRQTSELDVTGLRVLQHGNAPQSASIWLEVQRSWEVRLRDKGVNTGPSEIPTERTGDVVEVAERARAQFARGNRHDGRTFYVAKDWSDWKGATIAAYSNGRMDKASRIESPYRLGAVTVLDTDAAGRNYVQAEQFQPSSAHAWMRVFIKSHRADGTPERLYELPYGDMAHYPGHGVRVGPTGRVFALVPTQDGTRIDELLPVSWAETTLPSADVSDASTPPAAQGAGGPSVSKSSWFTRAVEQVMSLVEPESAYAVWDRFDAYDRAMDYCNNTWYCSAANYARSCGDYLPRYITKYKTNYSVPYCWGGFDLRSQFDSDMSAGLDAGDINCTGGKRTCTSGVDCSGFVGRLWGLGTKPSVATIVSTYSYYLGLPGVSTQRLGDAYCRVYGSDHVMFLDYVTSGGCRFFESTTVTPEGYVYDRAVHPVHAYSSLPNYYVRRYNNWWQ